MLPSLTQLNIPDSQLHSVQAVPVVHLWHKCQVHGPLRRQSEIGQRPHPKPDAFKRHRIPVTNPQLEVTIANHPRVQDRQILDGERRFRIPRPIWMQHVQLADELMIQLSKIHLRIHVKAREFGLIADPARRDLDESVAELREAGFLDGETGSGGMAPKAIQEAAAGRKRREREALERSFEQLEFRVGKKTWKREDLYDRA